MFLDGLHVGFNQVGSRRVYTVFCRFNVNDEAGRYDNDKPGESDVLELDPDKDLDNWEVDLEEEDFCGFFPLGVVAPTPSCVSKTRATPQSKIGVSETNQGFTRLSNHDQY